jgi:hypothetical protein
VWFVKKPVRNDLHPTMKPVERVERAIRNSSKTRDTVFDAFGGSGSTLIACEESGRQARLIELEPKYCDVIVRRFQEFSGKEATLGMPSMRFDVSGTTVRAWTGGQYVGLLCIPGFATANLATAWETSESGAGGNYVY